MSGARTAAINTAGLALSSALNFCALFLWVRLLTPAEFGIYALVSASALLLNALMFEWLRVVGARTLYDSSGRHLVHDARADALLALSLVVAAVLLVLAAVVRAGDVSLPLLAPEWLPLICAFALSEMVMAVLMMVSRVRMLAWQFFAASVLRAALSILFGLVLVLGLDLGATGVVAGTVAAQLVAAIALMARDSFWRRLRLGRDSRASLTEYREILTLGYPLIASSALAYGASVADRYLVNAVLGEAQLGYYAAAFDMLQKSLGFLMLAINISAYPALVRAYEDRGEGAARSAFEENFALQLGLGLPVALMFACLAPGLSALLLGAMHAERGAALLPWVAAAALLRLMTGLHLQIAFHLTRRTGLMMVAPAVTLATLLSVGPYATRHSGLAGTATAALVAQVLAYCACLILAKRQFRFRLLTLDVLKIVAASAAMVLLLLPLARFSQPLPTLAACAGGGVVYVLMLFTLRVNGVRPLAARAALLLRRG